MPGANTITRVEAISWGKQSSTLDIAVSDKHHPIMSRVVILTMKRPVSMRRHNKTATRIQ